MQQRKPGARAPEKCVATARVGTAEVHDKLGPAVAVPRQCAHRFERNGRAGAVELLDQAMPSDVESQVLRLVNDACPIGETHDQHTAAVIVWIGETAGDVHDLAGRSVDEIAANSR